VSIERGLWALAFVAVVCLLSGFTHGALGFGFPIVATPLVALVIDIKPAIALLAPVTLVLVLISALRHSPCCASSGFSPSRSRSGHGSARGC
jgi:uncharacterized membrane protein YfcA